MTAMYLALVAIAAIVLNRSQLVYKARIRRIGEISAACNRDLLRDGFYARMERRYAELDAQSYCSQLLDLRRWTYRQFFPSEVE